MPSQVIVDNWSLQHIAELLTGDVSEDFASVIAVSEDTHKYDSVSELAIQTEALFELLTLIVLKDEIIVDERFRSAWDTYDTPLLDLYRANLLHPVPFTSKEKHYAELRAHLVGQLCVTSSLKIDQARNEKSWAETRVSVNPFLAAVLWGGAGMLARSHYFRTPYCPHPLRRRLFVEADVLPGGTRSIERLHTVISSKRLEIVNANSDKKPLLTLQARLPPIPIQVIAESNSPSKFIQTALALRDEYRPLRAWLSDAEIAINQGNMKSIKEIEETFERIGTSTFSDFFSNEAGASISIGIGALSIKIPITPRAVGNLFGVRAIMNRMVFGTAKHNGLTRFCRLIGVEGSSLEHQLLEHFNRTNQSGT